MSTTNNAVNTSLSGQTGSGAFVGSNSPSIANGINDVNGNPWVSQTARSSAVNYIDIVNGATGVPPVIQSLGSDTDVGLTLQCKGNSNVLLVNNGNIILSNGYSTTSDVNYVLVVSNATGSAPIVSANSAINNDVTLQVQGKGTGGVAVEGTSIASPTDAAAGYVGEVISSVISSASAVSLTNNTPEDVTSINLTAGDWDVWGNVNFPSITVGASGLFGWISSSSATLPDVSLVAGIKLATAALGQGQGFVAPSQRFNVGSGGLTIYLSTYALFASGAVTACGGIYARRRR